MEKKIVKIIATSFYFRSVRMNTELCGDPPKFTLHSQNFTTNEEIENLLLLNIKKENECNPGYKVDLAFVNNNVGNEKGNKFIEKLNLQKLKNGKIITIQNINKGWSYGAFNKGYETLKDEYDYFIFTEDDIIINRDNYAKISLDTFENTQNCGFVSYGGVSSWLNKKYGNENLVHAHGAWGFTSKKILEKIHKQFGKLPHSELSEKKNYMEIITEGEIKFTNTIHKMGYLLVEAPKKLFNPAFDLMRGIDKPWKANKYEALKWKTKKKLRETIYLMLKNLNLYNFYKFSKNKIIKLFN